VGKKLQIDNGNSFVYVGHSYKYFDQAICYVQNKGIDVPIRLVGMVHNNVWSLSLKVMIIIPNMKHFLESQKRCGSLA
jgi:transposase-like protein